MSDLLHLSLLGRPFSPIYAMVMRLRASLYARGILTSYSLPVPVISVGNLTMGGTGKTPTVRYLAETLLGAGYRPAVVSRGYGGTAAEAVNVVADGRRILLNATAAGDEPYMLATAVAGLVVITGKKRILPCRYACEHLGCDIIVLDDGFQHLQVRRDLDIVLFNATILAGNGHVFPGGELREGLAALQRADCIMLTGVAPVNRDKAETFAGWLHQRGYFHGPVFTAQNRISGIFDMVGRPVDPPYPYSRFHAFSGIAHPDRFIASLQQCAVEITGHSRFADHASYSPGILSSLAERARRRDATALITTQKDWAKIKDIPCPLPTFYLGLELQPEPLFFEQLQSRLSHFSPAAHQHR
ncbi:MAG: tetraacyldisaccharide 4'-kinase [Desulfopila sp.]